MLNESALNGIARDLAAVRAELAERVAADQSARTANELTATIATGSTTTDHGNRHRTGDPCQR